MMTKFQETAPERKFQPTKGAETGLRVTDGHRIEGYASLFDQVDQGGDCVVKGAYQRSLQAMGQTGARVKMLWQHDPAQPIGLWEEVHEDHKGLWVKGRILTDLAQGREAALLLQEGAIDGLSIGYRTLKSTRTAKSVRLLQEIDLWEVSLVTFPMLANARVQAKMADDVTAAIHTMTQVLTKARQAIAAF